LMFDRVGQMLKRRQLQSIQDKGIKRIVNYAYRNVPFYKKKLSEAGVKPQSIKNIEDLRKVPFTVKTDLRDNYPLGLLGVPQTQLYALHASSGTTGKPIVVAYTRHDLERWGRLMGRCLDATGVRKGDVVQNMYGYGLFTGGLGIHYGSRAIGATVVPSSVGNTKRQLMLMKDLRTTVVTCTPSYMVYLIEASRAEGYSPKRDFALKVGVFGAEPWSEEARKRIGKHSDSKPTISSECQNCTDQESELSALNITACMSGTMSSWLKQSTRIPGKFLNLERRENLCLRCFPVRPCHSYATGPETFHRSMRRSVLVEGAIAA